MNRWVRARRVDVLIAAAGFVAVVGLCVPHDAAGYTTATGPRGGAAAAGPRGAVAVGPRGGAAAAGRRGAVAVGPGGNAAAVARPSYPAYRPPVAAVRPVPVYPGYVQPAPAAGAFVAGALVGATVAAAATAPAPPTNVVVVPPSAPAALPMGAQLQSLPGGCTTLSVNSVGYFQCGGSWLRAFMQGPNVSYVVVPAP